MPTAEPAALPPASAGRQILESVLPRKRHGAFGGGRRKRTGQPAPRRRSTLQFWAKSAWADRTSVPSCRSPTETVGRQQDHEDFSRTFLLCSSVDSAPARVL